MCFSRSIQFPSVTKHVWNAVTSLLYTTIIVSRRQTHTWFSMWCEWIIQSSQYHLCKYETVCIQFRILAPCFFIVRGWAMRLVCIYQSDLILIIMEVWAVCVSLKELVVLHRYVYWTACMCTHQYNSFLWWLHFISLCTNYSLYNHITIVFRISRSIW